MFQRDRNIFEMIGGRSDDVTYLDSVESNIDDNGWTVSQLRLPNGGMHHHCIVQLNDHRAFLAGGLKVGERSQNANARF